MRFSAIRASARWSSVVCALIGFTWSTAYAQMRTDTSPPANAPTNAPARPSAPPATPVSTNTSSQNSAPSSATNALPAPRSIVVLLPTEQPLLRRAAQTVRDAIRTVHTKARVRLELKECGYGNEGVVAAYERCVNEKTDAVIGPLGRNDVTALMAAKLKLIRPTLMLSAAGATPPENVFVLSPDLESEAEAIAKQSTEDACRKPVLVEASGALATRISLAMNGYFRNARVATPLLQASLGADQRDRWQRLTDGWRRDGVDCVLFAGNGATLAEFRPYLRNIIVYATSASYENELDRIVDWTGVRIADSPLVLDTMRSDYALFAPSEPLSPTLLRLYALGLDAARITFEAVLTAPSGAKDDEPNAAAPKFAPAESYNGAIGHLSLQQQQYLRTPAIGEFRVRTPAALGN